MRFDPNPLLATLQLCVCVCFVCRVEGVEQQRGEGRVSGPGGAVGLRQGRGGAPEAQAEEEGTQHGR